VTNQARPLPGGKLEHAVLMALWELERASVRQIHERVGVPTGLAYTTTAKVLDRLAGKGLVARTREGQVWVYRPRVAREHVERARMTDVLRHSFRAAPRPAVAALVEAVEAIDPNLLDDLARAVARRRKVRRGS
jgi:predicted transcriptional regulator